MTEIHYTKTREYIEEAERNVQIIAQIASVLSRHPEFTVYSGKGTLVIGDGDLESFFIRHGDNREGGLAGSNGCLLRWWGYAGGSFYEIWYGPSAVGHKKDWGCIPWPRKKDGIGIPFGNNGGRTHQDLIEAIEVLIPGFTLELLELLDQDSQFCVNKTLQPTQNGLCGGVIQGENCLSIDNPLCQKQTTFCNLEPHQRYLNHLRAQQTVYHCP